MTRLEAALLDVVSHLEQHGIPYILIGGFANLHWGKPRLTEDLDLKISVPETDWPAFLAGVAQRFSMLSPDPLALLRDTRVAPVRTQGGVRVDFVVAGLPYEEEAIRRASPLSIAGRTVKLCAAEDLVIHKIISDRPRDREDVRGVIHRQIDVLDRGYLDPRVQAMSEGLDQPEILGFYRTCLAEAEKHRSN